MKEQTGNTEVQINEEEIGKLPEKEFRIMIVKMIKNLENKMEKMQESINKNLEDPPHFSEPIPSPGKETASWCQLPGLPGGQAPTGDGPGAREGAV